MELKARTNAGRAMLKDALVAAGAGDVLAAAGAGDTQRATELEAEVASHATTDAHYGKLIRQTTAYLKVQAGLLPDTTIGRLLARGALKAPEVVAGAQNPSNQPDERETVRRMFARYLCLAWAQCDGADGKKPDGRIATIATAVELSCYNRAIVLSRQNDPPIRRAWDSPEFVDLYGARCEAIGAHLDPSSATCRAYGATLAARLLQGQVPPSAVGGMAERDLCAAATERERAEIAHRAAQKIVAKVSSIYSCPKCHAKNCEYVERQDRSADEARSVYCKCQTCGHSFRG